MPRPPIQHHKHIISLAPETLEAIESVRQTFLLGKVARTVGEAAKGVLGHPVGFIAVVGPLIAFLIAYFHKAGEEEGAIGIAGRDLEREWINMILGALPVTDEARDNAVNNLLGAIRTIRKLLGLTAPPPPPEFTPIPGPGERGREERIIP